MKVICDIYKSTSKDEMYLYVKKTDALTKVPEALLDMFGKPKLAMTMLLRSEKKLARVDVLKVLEQLEETGFFLQLPPPKDMAMQLVNEHNSKIGL
jgi:uncharacterized protein YcgL (UPF0745 family)